MSEYHWRDAQSLVLTGSKCYTFCDLTALTTSASSPATEDITRRCGH